MPGGVFESNSVCCVSEHSENAPEEGKGCSASPAPLEVCAMNRSARNSNVQFKLILAMLLKRRGGCFQSPRLFGDEKTAKRTGLLVSRYLQRNTICDAPEEQMGRFESRAPCWSFAVRNNISRSSRKYSYANKITLAMP